MRSRVFASVALLAVVLAPGAALGEEKEPCLPQSQGARLADNLYNVSLMVKLLEHLKGCEDPRLKALIEINLQWAAANAREAIGHGARFASPYIAVNMLKPVRDARRYASEHQLAEPPSAPGEKPEASLMQNLEVVEAWLQKNQ